MIPPRPAGAAETATDVSSGKADNPFSASRVQPGVLRFRMPDRLWREVDDRLRSGPGLWQVVGGHGTGKTSLARRLCRRWRREGGAVLWSDGLQRPPAAAPPGGLWIVDAAERLSVWRRWRWRRAARRRAARLILLTHRDLGLPPLVRLQPDAALVRELVGGLLEPYGLEIPEREIERCFQAAQGNVRETLFLLYDYVEQLRTPPGSSPTLDARGRTSVLFRSV